MFTRPDAVKVVAMHNARRIAPLFVSVLLVAGCSSGGDTPSEPFAATQPAPASPEAAKAEGPDAGRAKAANLQPADFPPGFEPQPEDPVGGLQIERLWGELTRCLGVDSSAQRTGVASSPTFLRGLATQARSTVEYTSEASANAIAAAITGPKFQSCANEAFNADVKRAAPEGAVPGPVTVAAVAAPPSAVASKTSSFRITVTLKLDELTIPLHQDFHVSVDRGMVVRMLFLNPGSEFPPDLERSLVQKVTSRL